MPLASGPMESKASKVGSALMRTALLAAAALLADELFLQAFAETTSLALEALLGVTVSARVILAIVLAVAKRKALRPDEFADSRPTPIGPDDPTKPISVKEEQRQG